eukprot:TRINITY_DN3722_c0_g1_i1.p1 TRINITY_DN3722_c0_g1~~TRINITY_DN3722_c0_g1_i1.p1  ORF type:complete len:270 (-),score=36.86 TRINITY_DN3722_c0_g1_i1:126-935(-)
MTTTTTPTKDVTESGTSDALPSFSIYVSGLHSNAGKSTVCLALIDALLNMGYKPSELAYIKPVTQCGNVQLVTKYCAMRGVKAVGMGPVVFYQGHTREIINNECEDTPMSRREKIQKAYDRLKEGRKVIVLDGVGYPAVGSVAGVSNAQVAAHLKVPMLLIGKGGVGDAIDSVNMARAYIGSCGARVSGVLFNKVGCGRHTLESCKELVPRYFEHHADPPSLNVYGFLPTMCCGKDSSDSITTPATDKCTLVPKEEDLIMSQADRKSVV